MKNLSLLEFLEAALKDALESNPQKIVVAFLSDDGVTVSYHKCNYADLQRIGQEVMNEGMFRG